MRTITFMVPDNTRLSLISYLAASLGCQLRALPNNQLIATPRPPRGNKASGAQILCFPGGERLESASTATAGHPMTASEIKAAAIQLA